MATIQEAREHKTLVVKLIRKSKPEQFNGQPNSNNVVFIDAVNVLTGQALEKPLTITESRARMLGMTQLLIDEDAATTTERTNADGKVVKSTEQDMLVGEQVYMELDVIVVPDGKVGDWGYKTNRDVTVNGKTYKAGDIVPYQTVNTMIVQKIIGRPHPNDFKSKLVTEHNAAIDNAVKLSSAHAKFEVIMGGKYDVNNPEHRSVMLQLLA